jgi:hypothetical protein
MDVVLNLPSFRDHIIIFLCSIRSPNGHYLLWVGDAEGKGYIVLIGYHPLGDIRRCLKGNKGSIHHTPSKTISFVGIVEVIRGILDHVPYTIP